MMLGYIIRRLLSTVGIFLLIGYVIWLCTTPTGYAALRQLSLMSLLPVDYLLWLQGVLHGDLGYSVKEHVPVLGAIQSHLLVTALLVVPAFLLQQMLAIGVGVSAGVRPRSWFDRVAVGAATLLVAIPPFWLALLVVALAILIQWPALDISNLRLSGYAFNTPGYWQFFAAHRWEALGDIARHLVLPIGVLALLGSAGDGLYVRQRMTEVMQTEYIRAARARGLPMRVVRWKHGLRNAMLPILTNITTQLPQLVFAAVIVEFVFQLPGAGWLFAHAVYIPPQPASNGPQGLNALIDYALLSGMLIIFAVITLLSGLFTDVLYALADPRIRVGRADMGVVANPLRSRLTVARVGTLTVRLGPALSVVLVALALTVVGVTIGGIRELYTPVVGDWSGTLVVDQISQKVTLPVFMHLSVGADGKVQGQVQTCTMDVMGKNSIVTVSVSGATENRTAIGLSGNSPPAPNEPSFTFTGLSVGGAYSGGKGAFDLTGLAYYTSGGQFSAELQANPHGSLAQFQHGCG